MFRFIPVLFGFILLACAFSSAHAQTAPPIIISQDLGAPAAGEITVPVAPDATAAATDLYVRAAAPTTDPLHVSLGLFFSDAQGIRHNEITVAITAHVPVSGTVTTEDVDASASAFALPADATTVRVTVSVSNVSTFGTFTGKLAPQVNGAPATGPTIVLVRQAKPQLHLIQAGDSNAITLPANAPQLDALLDIESKNATATTVQVFVNALVGPDGAAVAPDLTMGGNPLPQEITVPGLSTVTLRMQATLAQTGTYQSALSLVYGGERQTTSLKIERTRTAVPVKIEGVQTATGDLGWLLPDEARLHLSLTNTSGADTVIDMPALAALNKVGESDSLTQAHYDGLTVEQAGTTVIAPLTLKPQQATPLELVVNKITDAGKYRGTVQVSAPDKDPVSIEINFLLRQAWGVAAVYIIIGILVSGLIQYLGNVLRPRLAEQMQVSFALQEIEELERAASDLSEEEKKLPRAWVRRLRRLYWRIEMGQESKAEAPVKEIQGKLKLFGKFITLRRRVWGLKPDRLLKKYQPRLLALEKRLADETKEDKDIAAIETDMDALNVEIDKDVLAEFNTQIASLTQALKRFKPVAGTPEEALLKQATDALAAATAAVNETPPRIEFARKQYEEARRAYAGLYLSEMDARLKTAPQTPPKPFTDAQAWQALVGRIQPFLTEARGVLQGEPERALAALDRAATAYVKAALDTMRAQVSVNTPPLADEVKKQVTAKLDAVAEQLTAGNPGEANRLADEAVQLLYPPQRQPGLSGGAATAVVADVLSFLGFVPGAAAGSAPGAAVSPFEMEPPPLLQIRARSMWVNVVVLVAVAAIAVLLGVQLLWLPSATWGSPADVIIAILWGLGVHQVTNQGFTNFAGLMDKVLGKPAAGAGGGQ